jgi:hypothetical protein
VTGTRPPRANAPPAAALRAAEQQRRQAGEHDEQNGAERDHRHGPHGELPPPVPHRQPEHVNPDPAA